MVLTRSKSPARGRNSVKKDAKKNTDSGPRLPTPDRNSHHVFFYPANLLGYFRIILLFVAVYFYMNVDHRRFLLFYALSFGLDMLDGPLARALGHTTKFGGALDILTDKFTSPSLFLKLAGLYPTFAGIFTLLMSLDVSSHFFHLYASLLRGHHSHKLIDPSQNWVVRTFYGNRAVFVWTCLGHELFLIFAYWRWFEEGLLRQALDLGLTLTLPSFVFKSTAHLAQLLSACEGIAQYDLEQKRIKIKKKSK